MGRLVGHLYCSSISMVAGYLYYSESSVYLVAGDRIVERRQQKLGDHGFHSLARLRDCAHVSEAIRYLPLPSEHPSPILSGGKKVYISDSCVL